MQIMNTVGQRILKLLGGQGKTDRRPDGQADSSIPLPFTILLCGGIIIYMHDYGKLTKHVFYVRTEQK